jgi:hypothetical protein
MDQTYNIIYPQNILFVLWTFQWNRKDKNRRSKTNVRREVAIHSLILLSYLFMTLILTKNCVTIF